MTQQQPQPGRFGAAVYSSYTYRLSLGANGLVLYFANTDLGANGAGYLRTAFGVQPDIWIWASLILGGGLATILPTGTVNSIYHQYTGTHYMADRIGYAKSGASDVSFWSGFAAYITALLLFTFVIPAGWLWIARPIALTGLALILGPFLARRLAHRVFFRLYGPPQYPPL